jgi:hypothetical protein
LKIISDNGSKLIENEPLKTLMRFRIQDVEEFLNKEVIKEEVKA